MEDLKQKYLQIIYGKKESYSDDELQVVDNLIDTHRIYNKENLFTETQVLEYGENCFEAGFAKCDIVEAGLEAKETDIEINWILIKLMRKWQTLQNAKEQIVR